MTAKHPPVYYPVMLDLCDKAALVVGGGKVARRKVDGLLNAGAKVTVIAPEIITMPSGVMLLYREYESTDITGNFIIIAATDNASLNARIANDALTQNILVNIVDNPEIGSLILPAVVQRGALQIAVSTSGSSPALASIIKQELAVKYGAEYQLLTDLLWQLRDEFEEKMIASAMNDDARRLCWRTLVQSPLLEMLRSGEDAETAARDLLTRMINQVNIL